MHRMEQQSSRAERQAEKLKRQRKRALIRRIKLGAMLCVALVVVLYILFNFVFFKIEKIEVLSASGDPSSSAYYTAEEIAKASGAEIGDGLLRVSKSKTASQIQSLLPYIGEVTVKKSIPSTLKLVVEDTSPFFGVEYNDCYILLNRDFKVLGPEDYLPQGSAKLVGVEFSALEEGSIAEFEESAYVDRINTLVESCADAGVTNITKYDISNIANVKIVINSRITIILGTITELSEKLNLGLKTMENELENNSNAHIIINVTDCDRSYVRDDTSPIEEDTVDYEEYSIEQEKLSAQQETTENNQTANEPVEAVG